jgi:hypothetical protein
MSDRDYLVKKSDILSSYMARTARAAVLTPLAGRPGQTTMYAYHFLRQRWIARMLVLIESGWSTSSDELMPAERAYCMRNCPPFGVKFKASAHCCRRWMICPFCYAREIQDIFAAVTFGCSQLSFEVENEDGSLSKFPEVKLIGLRQIRSGLNMAELGWDADGWHGLVKDKLRFTISKFKESDVLGACSRFLYVPQAEPGLLSVVRSTLLLLPLDVAIPSDLQKSVHKTTADINHKNISEILAWCFRYPVGLMTGDAGTGAQILNGMAGDLNSSVRCAHAQGLFHNRRLREITDNFKRRVRSMEISH